MHHLSISNTCVNFIKDPVLTHLFLPPSFLPPSSLLSPSLLPPSSLPPSSLPLSSLSPFPSPPSFPSFLPFPPQAKVDVQSRLKQLQADIVQLQDSLEEEQESKSAIQKQLMTTKNDAASWKNKFENEATPRLEELEDSK